MSKKQSKADTMISMFDVPSVLVLSESKEFHRTITLPTNPSDGDTIKIEKKEEKAGEVYVRPLLEKDSSLMVKPTGDKYVVSKRYLPPGRIPPVLSGYELHECFDGFFAVIDNNDKQLFYRLGPVIINQIQDHLNKR